MSLFAKSQAKEATEKLFLVDLLETAYSPAKFIDKKVRTGGPFQKSFSDKQVQEVLVLENDTSKNAIYTCDFVEDARMHIAVVMVYFMQLESGKCDSVGMLKCGIEFTITMENVQLKSSIRIWRDPLFIVAQTFRSECSGISIEFELKRDGKELYKGPSDVKSKSLLSTQVREKLEEVDDSQVKLLTNCFTKHAERLILVLMSEVLSHWYRAVE